MPGHSDYVYFRLFSDPERVPQSVVLVYPRLVLRRVHGPTASVQRGTSSMPLRRRYAEHTVTFFLVLILFQSPHRPFEHMHSRANLFHFEDQTESEIDASAGDQDTGQVEKPLSGHE